MAQKKRTGTKGKHSTRRTRRSKAEKQTALFQSLALFAVGLVLIAMLFFPGQAAWLWLRQALRGLLGVSFWLAGGLCLYFAVLLARGDRLGAPLAKTVVGVLALSGVTVIFSRLDVTGKTLPELVHLFYQNGQIEPLGGGLAGLPVGGLLLVLCGRPAANILVLILAVCAVMVIFGVTPAEIWQTLSYHASTFTESQQQAAHAAAEGYRTRRAERLAAHPLPARPEPEEAPETEETAEPGSENGVMRRIGAFFADLFGREEPDQAEPLAAEEPQEAARVRDNRRSVMETVLRNSSRNDIDIDLGEAPAAVSTGTSEPIEPVVIGPGGTFGMNPLEEKPSPMPQAPMDPFETPHPDEPDVILPGGMGAAAATFWDEPAQNAPEPAAAPEPVCEVLPQTPQEPGPARLTPEPPPAQEDSDWISIGDEPAGAAESIDALTAAAMEKPAAAEHAAAAAAAQTEPVPAPAAYRYPPLELFDPQQEDQDTAARAELKENAEKLVGTLESFGVKTRMLDISRGPSVTRYELQPLAGVKISRITSLADDIALNLAVAGVRMEAPIPGKPAVGIEVPNRKSTSVSIRSILESQNYARMTSPLTIALGKDIAGVAQVADLCKMPHLLIAGSTGSGKSVCVNSIIMSFLYRSSPEDVKLILIDPKVVELAEYNGIPHLLMPVVTEPRKAAGALCSAVGEMERRYHLFAENNVRDIKTYNKLAAESETLEKLPYIAIIIDELADLMMVAGKEVEDYICRIAQKARAAGMHLIVATQRPSVDVITGLIKANIPSRIAFAVSSQVDSRTILDGAGAEKLLGMGDMLFMPVGAPKPTRIQGTYVKDEEISRVLDFIKQDSPAAYDENMIAAMEKAAKAENKGGGSEDGAEDTDPMFNQCVECVIDAGQASASLLQRKCRLGYARAARIMDEMEQKGLIGPSEGAKPRAVLISRQQWLERSLNCPNDEA